MSWRSALIALGTRSLARALAAPTDGLSVAHAVEWAERLRATVDEVQTAAWHLAGLPAGREVRAVARRTASIAHKVVRLERAVARLERRAATRR